MELSVERVSDQLRERWQVVKQLERMGVSPYPKGTYRITHTTQQLLAEYQGGAHLKDVAVAGRLMGRRLMGKVAFFDLYDHEGRIQLFVARDEVGGDKYDNIVKKLLDIGDWLWVRGEVFSTRSGEVSVRVREMSVLAKCLRPLPPFKLKEGKLYTDIRDPELLVRHRYLDFIIHPDVRERFVLRARIIDSIRSFLNSHGLLEVETPILHPVYGGAFARPFITYLEALDMRVYLRVADELYLKRLIVGGFPGVYEFSRDFRNEGIDRTHNPEFTMLEVYVAFKDYLWMKEFTERLIEHVVRVVHGSTRIRYGEYELDFTPPFRTVRFFDVLNEAVGRDVQFLSDEELKQLLREAGVAHLPEEWHRGKLYEKLFEKTVESKLVQPTFVIDYPAEMCPLAHTHREDERLAERFELICAGMELCNAYSELNDPRLQYRYFRQQAHLREKGDEEAMPFDEDFLMALEYGMPPTAGLGVGIDRLVMLLTNQHSIQDVILFPFVKPKPLASHERIPYEEGH